MSNTNLIPSTQNEARGFLVAFCGTMDEHAAAAWPLAMTAIANATGQHLESVRTFLDSRAGRIFAEDVLDRMGAGQLLADAIDTVIQRWTSWTIDFETSEACCIPNNTSYLMGRVIYANYLEIANAIADNA